MTSGYFASVDIDSEILRFIGSIRIDIFGLFYLIKGVKYKTKLRFIPFSKKNNQLISRAFQNIGKDILSTLFHKDNSEDVINEICKDLIEIEQTSWADLTSNVPYLTKDMCISENFKLPINSSCNYEADESLFEIPRMYLLTLSRDISRQKLAKMLIGVTKYQQIYNCCAAELTICNNNTIVIDGELITSPNQSRVTIISPVNLNFATITLSQ